jgi:GMP synthase (glutamine-hydrolysing)
MDATSTDKIAVLDFGGQYAHLIANRIRRLGVYAEIFDSDVAAQILKNDKGIKGIILSGGPASVYEANSPKYDKNIFQLGLPMLGICYGQQLISHALGGKVLPGKTKEYGIAKIKLKTKKGIFAGLSDEEQVWMSHGDSVKELPKGFLVAAETKDCPAAAICNPEKKIYGVQFHPEVTHTLCGMKILSNFIEISGCKKGWSMETYLASLSEEIKAKAAGKKVFLLVSGGVDSAVCFALLEKALGKDRVFGLHIDTGFMRENESKLVIDSLAEAGYEGVKLYDTSKEFYAALDGVSEPEEKRKIIGRLFIELTNEYMKKLKLNDKEWLIAQGTIYPDTIETGRTKNADVIKTHHNRVGIAQEMIAAGKIIEPLQFLYKDEVRELGAKLGLPKKLVNRHPFPGPGLAIRVLCSNNAQSVLMPLEKSAEDKINEFLKKNNYGFSAKILPVMSVGVQGDSRSYRHPVLIYAKPAKKPGKIDWAKLEEISTLLTNNFKEINRVLIMLWPGALPEIVLQKSLITKERVEILKKADSATMAVLEEEKLLDKVWQCPTVLLPVAVESKDGMKECVVVRPVNSTEAMTANFARLPEKAMEKITARMQKLRIGAVFYDITNKPPATIEWE